MKFILPWILSNLQNNRNPLADEVPWVAFEAMEWLERFLTCDMVVFEYGSGGSTVFFSKRVKKVASVEHDSGWHQIVSNNLKRHGIKNCNYFCLIPQKVTPGSKLDVTSPNGYASKEYPNVTFESYVKSIDEFPDSSFDLVFIDGRARPSYILHALNKIRPEGFIVVDNAERKHYTVAMGLLSSWKRKDFFGPGPYGRYFWQTTLWQNHLIH